jgi:glycosyltransferase involved in cell wall biosynthesis
LPIQYILSEKSVCIQRNIGIRKAETPWVFLCDDDVEVPPDYLQQLVAHATAREGQAPYPGSSCKKKVMNGREATR